MEPLWQQIVIAIAVIGAVVYLVHYYRQRKSRKTHCEGCPERCSPTTLVDGDKDCDGSHQPTDGDASSS